jgi:hypothetical protein
VVYDSAPYGKFKQPRAQIWNVEQLMKSQKKEQLTIGFILTSSEHSSKLWDQMKTRWRLSLIYLLLEEKIKKRKRENIRRSKRWTLHIIIK